MFLFDDVRNLGTSETSTSEPNKLREIEQKALRAYVKSLTWTGVASTDMFVISAFFMNKKSNAALATAVGAVLKFAVVFPAHEYIWGKIPFGINNPKTTHWRTLAKTMTYRAVGSAETFTRAWVFGGHKVNTAAAVTAAEFVSKSILYFLHDEAWKKVGHEKLWEKTMPIMQGAYSSLMHLSA